MNMIKIIKVKKQLRLDELIKYILDNDIVGKRYEERMDYDSYSITHAVHVTGGGEVIIEGTYKSDQTFTVEVEEEITEDTEFEAFVIITDKGILKSINNYHNMRAVRGLLENYEVEQKIYALIDNNLQLIWEVE